MAPSLLQLPVGDASASPDEVPSERQPHERLLAKDPQAPTGLSAEALLRALAPEWSAQPGRLERLAAERVKGGRDVARLDKEDLRELGLGMAERGRVLDWARSLVRNDAAAASNVVPEHRGQADIWRRISSGFNSPTSARDGTCKDHDSAWGELKADSRSIILSPSWGSESPATWADSSSSRSHGPLASRTSRVALTTTLAHAHSEEERLDDLECQADFWCSCFATSNSVAMPPSKVEGWQKDVRENILEAFFDCTPERVREVFVGMGHDTDGPIESLEELQTGLERCGLSGLDGSTLCEVFAHVTGSGRGLHLMAFESILCRLRLAQLLLKPFSSLLHSSLGVVDYTFSKAVVKHVDEAQLREFFFGHRSAPKLLTSREGPPVRWVHMQKFNLTLMLALTVKYSLHPLSVEDVIEQCPTKIDRFGRNYFLAVELLIVDDGSLGPSSQGQGQVPVRVRGQHVTAFCSGPPSLDTLLTLVQTDRNFDKDWPGGLGGVEEPEVSSHKVGTSGVLPPASAWPEKLRQRLLAARSRLRERRADFLLYTVVDLCADELVTVARAYLARLAWLEEDLRSHGDRSLLDLGEVSLARLQLAVVARRLRSLQRVVRRASEYGDLHTTGSADYWKDCADHLEEAHEDALHLADRCDALKAAHEQVMERGQSELVHLQNEEHKLQAERMNFLLFFLTVGTTFFTPLTFMSSVYGMNFTDPETGMSAIPELLTPNGYKFFWLGVVAYLVVAATVASCLYRRLNRKREKRAVPAQSGCANCASCLYSTSSSCGCGRPRCLSSCCR